LVLVVEEQDKEILEILDLKDHLQFSVELPLLQLVVDMEVHIMDQQQEDQVDLAVVVEHLQEHHQEDQEHLDKVMLGDQV
jgi:hypothetical protein